MGMSWEYHGNLASGKRLQMFPVCYWTWPKFRVDLPSRDNKFSTSRCDSGNQRGFRKLGCTSRMRPGNHFNRQHTNRQIDLGSQHFLAMTSRKSCEVFLDLHGLGLGLNSDPQPPQPDHMQGVKHSDAGSTWMAVACLKWTSTLVDINFGFI